MGFAGDKPCEDEVRLSAGGLRHRCVRGPTTEALRRRGGAIELVRSTTARERKVAGQRLGSEPLQGGLCSAVKMIGTHIQRTSCHPVLWVPRDPVRPSVIPCSPRVGGPGTANAPDVSEHKLPELPKRLDPPLNDRMRKASDTQYWTELSKPNLHSSVAALYVFQGRLESGYQRKR